MQPAADFSPVELELRNGRRVTVRAVQPEDRDKLQHALRSLSAEARYSRFMSPLRELSAPMLERAVRPDAINELQLVAVADDGDNEKIIAGARYSGTAGSTDCEFATAVVDDWHRLGLARRLLEMLMETARLRGYKRMEGYILASNAPMLNLAKRLGFVDVESPEGPSVRLLQCDLGKGA